MDVILIIISFILGWFFRIIYKYYINIGRLNRKKLSISGYKPSTYEVIKDTLRNIVIRYNSRNEDFFLNINISDSTVIQLLHRSHFPELSKSNEDIQFGIAVYIPIERFATKQRKQLESILKDHAESIIFTEIPFSYYVIDIGTKIRYGGELITLILKEVLKVEANDQIKIDLFDGGKLPYNLINFDSFRKQ